MPSRTPCNGRLNGGGPWCGGGYEVNWKSPVAPNFVQHGWLLKILVPKLLIACCCFNHTLPRLCRIIRRHARMRGMKGFLTTTFLGPPFTSATGICLSSQSGCSVTRFELRCTKTAAVFTSSITQPVLKILQLSSHAWHRCRNLNCLPKPVLQGLSGEIHCPGESIAKRAPTPCLRTGFGFEPPLPTAYSIGHQ